MHKSGRKMATFMFYLRLVVKKLKAGILLVRWRFSGGKLIISNSFVGRVIRLCCYLRLCDVYVYHHNIKVNDIYIERVNPKFSSVPCFRLNKLKCR